MTRILELTDPEGFVQVCDDACYDAQPGPCRCICGGIHHGIGEELAQRNVILFTAVIANKLLRGQPKGTKLVINALPFNMSLEIQV